MSDLIERQAVINTEGLDEQIRCEMCRNPMRTDRGCDGNCKYDERLYERIMQILGERINPLSSVQPEPCSDAISRQAAIEEIIAQEAIYSDDAVEILKRLPSVQPEPCEDTISRADAIRVASGYCHPANVAQELAKLPSVQAEPYREEGD